MADGILCKHCGRQETEHSFEEEEIEANEVYKKKLRGYKKSLWDCPGYKPENPKLARELAKAAKKEEDELENYRTHNHRDD